MHVEKKLCSGEVGIIEKGYIVENPEIYPILFCH
jgi:hypothetical protein